MRRARSTGPSLAQRAGFTLLEVIIAMGILAVGATAALALLVSATSTGRRGEHYVNTALIADSVFADIEADLHDGFTLDGLELAVDTVPGSPVISDGPVGGPKTDGKKKPGGAGGAVKAPPKKPPKAPDPPKDKDKTPPDPSPPGAQKAPDKQAADDPWANAKTYWLKKDQTPKAYPDYKYNVAITAIGGPPDDPWEFLVEVIVRWSDSGKRRSETYQTVLLKKLRQVDNELPPDPQK